MIGSNIARRYARALFSVTGDDRRYEDYAQELGRFSALLKENRNLSEFLANPVFAQPDKKAVADALLAKLRLSKLTANFLKLLVDKRRIGILSDIEACYRAMVADALKKVGVTVKTAFPLSGELSLQLQKKLEGVTGRQVEMTVQEDPGLLGGIVVRVGDMLYDGSISTQLAGIRNLLGEER